jgi:hypothetical protein
LADDASAKVLIREILWSHIPRVANLALWVVVKTFVEVRNRVSAKTSVNWASLFYRCASLA